MSEAAYDFTMFDAEGAQLVSLAKRFPEKRFLALYRIGVGADNVSYFSEAGDPVLLADTQEAARSAKLAFLKSAKTCILIVKDLRGIELFSSALRLLLQDQLQSLTVISKEDVGRLINVGTQEEQRQAEQLIKAKRLRFRQALNWSDFEQQ